MNKEMLKNEIKLVQETDVVLKALISEKVKIFESSPMICVQGGDIGEVVFKKDNETQEKLDLIDRTITKRKVNLVLRVLERRQMGISYHES